MFAAPLLRTSRMNVPGTLEDLMLMLRPKGKCYIVGGAVRDHLYRVEPKDFDVEVFGMTLQEMEEAFLKNNCKVDVVGKAFGILKVSLNGFENEVFDFAIPRKDNLVGIGHKAFEVELCPEMTVYEAQLRRDFTINAIYYDPDTFEFIDNFGGMEHLLDSKLVEVSLCTFSEDPLRVLRAMQFAARLPGGMFAEKTARLSAINRGDMKYLPVERIWEEFKKWTLARHPENGINVLVDSQWIENFPEWESLIEVKQEPEHHPEGNAFVHTTLTVCAMAELCRKRKIDPETRTMLVLAALCHDFGKATTTAVNEHGKITSYAHDQEGEKPTRSFLARIGCPQSLVEPIVLLVKNHMAHIGIRSEDVDKRMVRRLALRMGNVGIENLSILIEADQMGREFYPKKRMPETMKMILEMARAMSVERKPPEKVILGRHLIEQGLKPGKTFKGILDAAYEMQVNGEFITVETGIRLLKEKNLI